MFSWRAQQSEKQARCREQNESTAQARTAAPAEGSEGSFRCECGDGQCSCAITLTPTEYALVRAYGTHFAVARNHENPESEQVIQENERFAIVETVTGDATKLARRSDPRQRHRERCWAQAAASRPIREAEERPVSQTMDRQAHVGTTVHEPLRPSRQNALPAGDETVPTDLGDRPGDPRLGALSVAIQPPAALDGQPHPGVSSLVPAPEGGYGRGRSDSRLLRSTLLFLGVDALMLALAAAAATLAPVSAAGAPPVAWSVAYGVVVGAALVRLNASSRRLQTELLETLRGLLGAVSLGAVVVIFVSVFITGDGSVTGDGSGAHEIAGLAAYAFGFLTAGRLAASFALSHRLVERDLRRRALILGAGKIGNLTARRLLAQPDLGLQPVGFLDDDPLEMPGEIAVLPVLGGLPDLDRIVAEHDIEHFIVGFSMTSHQLMLALVRRCWELGVSVSLVPRLFEVAGDRAAVDRLGGLPLVSLAAPPSRGLGLAVKSAIDRAVAAVALLVLSPLLALVALAIRHSMGSPVMYRQHRVGRDGRHFALWKLRTMLGTPEADGEGNAEWAQAAVASAGDIGSFGGHAPEGLGTRVPAGTRCTPLGSFLRRTSVDELPQLWNVLRGDMSLIGPRPEMPHYVERFEEAIYRYSDRHRVKSGLTGWAQVHGLRGDTSLIDRVEWDNYYIENWSLWLDFKIALRTVHCIVRDAVGDRSGAGGRQGDTLKLIVPDAVGDRSGTDGRQSDTLKPVLPPTERHAHVQ